MRFQAAISTATEAASAAIELGKQLHAGDPDLLMVFASHHHGPTFEDLLSGIRDRINARNLVGATGESIIGPNREVEAAPAVAIWAAWMPGVRVLPFLIDQEDVQKFESNDEWFDRLGVRPEEKPAFVVLPEPFSIDADRCLQQLDAAYSGATIVGGMASGASERGQNRLFLNDQVLRFGMVGVSLCGPIHISTIVSQGCRAIGKPFVVTKSQDNIIIELGGRPAMQVLRQIYEASDSRDQALIQSGLCVGSVVDEHLTDYKPGDFLIRNLIGIVDNKALAIASLIRPGQTVQFHVRDAQTASDEMKGMLQTKLGELPHSPQGGLLFSCNGRGTRLFGRPNHDIGLVNGAVGDCQVAGFFAQGEIGPVGNRTFIHGFTSSLILFSGAE